MTRFRTIEKIFDPPPYHWVGNGFKVHNFLPRAIESNTRMSPFFLLDYNAKMHYLPSKEKRGVGVHPHRGLETVTIAYEGAIAHHDSVGNGGVINKGDVQWMTAGKAILHKEYHEKNYLENGGDFQMVQLWVNLPAKHKMTQPKYQELPNSILGKYKLENNSGIVNIIAGEYKGVKGPASTFTKINLFDLKIIQNTSIEFEFDKTHNTSLLVIEGEIIINEIETAISNQFVLFNNDGNIFSIKASNKSTILIMSGEPIDEPIAPYGPFLMNTPEEIKQTYEDYNNGTFGYLED